MKPNCAFFLRSLSLLAVPVLAAQHTLCASVAFATPSYSEARKHFNNGDLRATQKTLESILLPKSKVTKKELEEARKLYGVSLFLQNKKGEAENEFRQVLTANPSAKIRKQDVLDPQIEVLFESVRAKIKKGGNEKSEVSKSAPQKLPTAPANASLLVLQCNVKKASVFVDGIYVGDCANPITLEPGRHDITVSTEGYEDVTKTVETARGQSVAFAVSLKPYNEKAAPEVDEATEPNFGRKPESSSFDMAESVTAPLPAPQKSAGENTLIQLQPLQNSSEPEVFIQPQSYSPRGGSRSVVPRRSYLVALMPFGAGQFQNGEPTKGALSLGLQLTGVGLWAYSVFKTSTFQAKVDKDPATYNPSDVTKYKKNMTLLGNVSLGVAGFVYFVSAIDALVNIQNPAIVKLTPASNIGLAWIPNASLGVSYSHKF
jgi:hypothetical protein